MGARKIPRTQCYWPVILWEQGPSLKKDRSPPHPDSAEAVYSHRSPPRQMSHVSMADSASFQKSDSEKPDLITAFTKRVARGQFGHSGSQFARNLGGCSFDFQTMTHHT